MGKKITKEQITPHYQEYASASELKNVATIPRLKTTLDNLCSWCSLVKRSAQKRPFSGPGELICSPCWKKGFDKDERKELKREYEDWGEEEDDMPKLEESDHNASTKH